MCSHQSASCVIPQNRSRPHCLLGCATGLIRWLRYPTGQALCNLQPALSSIALVLNSRWILAISNISCLNLLQQNKVTRVSQNAFVLTGVRCKQNPVITNLWENDQNLCCIGIWLIMLHHSVFGLVVQLLSGILFHTFYCSFGRAEEYCYIAGTSWYLNLVLDHSTFLGNSPPTPLLTQPLFFLIITQSKMLGQGRGRWEFPDIGVPLYMEHFFVTYLDIYNLFLLKTFVIFLECFQILGAS